MKIAFNPSTVAALTSPPNNKDITFDLKGHNIFARGVKFYGTDTNTWRDIKVNNVSIGSNILDLRNGSNTTLTNTNGVVTINSTWRPVVDSLTSDSTTSSLSANQGRVLKSLIDTLSTDISNQYALRDGSNATGRWRGGLACFDVRDTNYIPRDLNMGLELLFLRNNTNDLNDGGIYNGVFSFRQWSSVSDWSGGKAHQLSFTDNENIWHRTSSGDDSWGAWKKLAYSTDIPSSLKNPYALTISLNGTSQGPYDGSAAKSINITPSSIGAATSGHTHDDRYLKLTGGTMQLGEGLKFHADDNYFGTYADARIISLLDGNDTICDGGLIIDERGTLNGKEYVTELLRIRDSEFKWRGADILHSGNYSGILDSRYYTESEVNSLLNTKLDRVNLSTGGWNPRGYNLAADYCYNGGDLSISESGGQIHVSIDGYFWQNEGQYRVLDTSDVAGLKGDLTLHQYLSNTDTTWWPLVWGGSSHNNTSDSTGVVYKSHDVLSWQTSSQTLYATRLATNSINLQSSRGIYQVTSGGTSPYKGIKLPNLQSNAIGLFSRVGNGSDEGGIILSEDTCVIYNSFDTGWGLSVRDKDLNQTDISADATVVFGVDQNHKVYSLGGFTKNGSSDSYVLLGGGGHKTESSLNVAYASNADKLDGHHETYFMRTLGVMGSDWNDNITAGCYKVQNPSKNTPGNYNFGMGLTLATENHADGENRICQIYFSHTHDYAMAVRTHNNSKGFPQDDSGWTSWGLVPTTAGNIASATKLQIARKIWGQSFDGTADVDNTLRIRHTTGNYCEGIRIQTSDGNWATIILGATADSGTNVNAWSIHRKSDNNFCISRNSSDGANGLVMTSTGMGLGTTAPTQRLDVVGNIRATGQIVREGSSQAWVNGRVGALLRETSVAGYHTLWSLKTTDGSWDFGEYNAGSSWNNVPVLSYVTDSNYASGNNTTTYQIRFPLDSGTVALTKNIPSSLPANGGNADTVDGVHLEWSGELAYDQYTWLAAWTNDGSKIKAVNKNQFAPASHSHNYYAVNENYGGFKKAERLPTSGFYQSAESESGGNAPWAGWMHLINCQHSNTGNNYALQIAASFFDNNTFKIRVTDATVNNAWRDIIHSGNIGSQTVANAYHLRINSANSWSNWYWAGQGGQPSWLWGSNDGTNMYVWNPSNFSVNYANSAGYASRLEGGNTPGWGTLTAANGFTNVSSWDYGSRGAYGLCGKNNALYMQLDGYFYQNEGQYRVIDTSEYNWTSLPNKIVAGNEFNIVNAGFKSGMWFNYLPINNRDSTATVQGYHFGNGAEGYTSVVASGFVKNGSSSSYVLLGDGGHAAISSLSVSYANNAGNASTLGGTSLGGLFTAFGNNAHNITATIGGVTKSFLVNYAADADKVDGVHITWAGALTSTSHLVAWESDGSALRDINPANVTVGSANYASSAGNADTVDGYHASQLAKAWSGASTTMNDVAQYNGNYFGMITGTGTGGFPNNDGGWTHVFQSSYNNNSGGDGNTGNFWVTQIANRAGTTSPWIRSRSGGSNISTGWTSWVRIMTKNDVDNYYWADIKVSTSSNTQTTPTFNTAYATNWFRARGNTGFYFQDHAGGWYMSDNDWIRTWGSKALYVNNTIRSTNYQAMYGGTSVSAAKLESATTLVYGTDTSSNSINSYLRGTTVTLQVKKGASINYNALQLTDTYIYCNNYCAMKYGAIVSGGNFTVNNNAYFSQEGLWVKSNDQKYYRQPVCIACGYAYDGPNANNNNRTQQVTCNQHANIALIDGNGRYRIVFPDIQANKFNREHISLQLTGCPHGVDSRGVSDARGSVSSQGNALSIEVYTSDDNSLNPSSFYFALWAWDYVNTN